jgi:hypothetical protein
MHEDKQDAWWRAETFTGAGQHGGDRQWLLYQQGAQDSLHQQAQYQHQLQQRLDLCAV